MKKLFILLAAVLCSVGFVSCGDDDDEPNGGSQGTEQTQGGNSSSALAKLRDNQMFVDSKVITCEGDYSSNDECAYPSMWCVLGPDKMLGIGVDIELSLIGKEIDLLNPGTFTGDQRLFVMMDKTETYAVHYSYSNQFMGSSFASRVDNQREQVYEWPQCVFKEGKLKTAMTNDGFSMSINATLQNGEVIAGKVFVPRDKFAND